MHPSTLRYIYIAQDRWITMEGIPQDLGRWTDRTIAGRKRNSEYEGEFIRQLSVLALCFMPTTASPVWTLIINLSVDCSNGPELL